MPDPLSESCEMPSHANNAELINKIVTSYSTVAVVGISKKEDRDSYKVSAYLLDNGFRVVPVNPTADEILGQKSYPSLDSIPFPLDVIDIFRKPSALPELAKEIVSLANKPKSVWFQIGVVNKEAVEIITSAGIDTVENRCLMVEHRKATSE